MDNPITAVSAMVHRLAADLSHADRQEIISAALVRVATGTEHALSAVRWSLADWLRDQTEAPAPVEDTDLRRELQRARRAVRSASDEDLAKWDSLLSRMPEREREVAVRLAAGYSMRDVSAELGIGLASADRARKAIAKRLVDPVLWHPILDALWDLPATRKERESAHRNAVSVAKPVRATGISTITDGDTLCFASAKWLPERSHAPKVTGGATAQRKLIFTTWFVPCHERRANPVMAWYPGVPIRKWEPTKPSGLWANALDLLSFCPPHAGKRSLDGMALAEDTLKPREAYGLAEGRRFYFDHAKHGPMLSAPLFNRGF